MIPIENRSTQTQWGEEKLTKFFLLMKKVRDESDSRIYKILWRHALKKSQNNIDRYRYIYCVCVYENTARPWIEWPWKYLFGGLAVALPPIYRAAHTYVACYCFTLDSFPFCSFPGYFSIWVLGYFTRFLHRFLSADYVRRVSRYHFPPTHEISSAARKMWVTIVWCNHQDVFKRFCV